ncbi:YoaK family protein [Sulfobacillus harzensis]|uniref:DUF1275 domain-containing protein n=1 Tax=Sulfobacillus harzensis TaxID=2729629 RepID=A0A7Y0Q268_9FIRM|nr:YoaK family protein [Sulfobacillus harzensis]NMP22863.1 DUF1275 domain-containing protein [Sulfobacillus harzensis]
MSVRNPSGIVVAITLVAGLVDALGYFRLGHVFIANMTGNLVLLSIALARGHLAQAMRSTYCLCGFALGAIFASWPLGLSFSKRSVLIGLGLEFFSLVFLSGLVLMGRDIAAIVVGSFGMGVQSRLAKHLHVAGAITTVVTSTLTQMMDDLLMGFRGQGWPRGAAVRLALFFAYAIGAMVAALGRRHPTRVVLLSVVVLAGLSLWVAVSRASAEPR